MVNPQKLSSTNIYDSEVEWKKIIKNLKKNPTRMMDIIPSPKVMRTITQKTRSKSPHKRDIESALSHFKRKGNW